LFYIESLRNSERNWENFSISIYVFFEWEWEFSESLWLDFFRRKNLKFLTLLSDLSGSYWKVKSFLQKIFNIRKSVVSAKPFFLRKTLFKKSSSCLLKESQIKNWDFSGWYWLYLFPKKLIFSKETCWKNLEKFLEWFEIIDGSYLGCENTLKNRPRTIWVFGDLESSQRPCVHTRKSPPL